MRIMQRRTIARTITATGALVMSLLLPLDAAWAQDKTSAMKITLATQNGSLHQFARDYARAIRRDSGGRLKVEVYLASQLGSISRQIEGLQFGAIQCAIIPPHSMSASMRALKLVVLDEHQPARRKLRVESLALGGTAPRTAISSAIATFLISRRPGLSQSAELKHKIMATGGGV
jgi:hypothetical protein